MTDPPDGKRHFFIVTVVCGPPCRSPAAAIIVAAAEEGSPMTHAEIAEYIKAASQLVWPAIFVVFAINLVRKLPHLVASGAEFAFEFMGNRLFVKPSTRPLDGASGCKLGPVD